MSIIRKIYNAKCLINYKKAGNELKCCVPGVYYVLVILK